MARYSDNEATEKMISDFDTKGEPIGRQGNFPITQQQYEASSVNRAAELYNNLYNNPPRTVRDATSRYMDLRNSRDSAIDRSNNLANVDENATMGSDTRIHYKDNPLSSELKKDAWRQSESAENALSDTGYTTKINTIKSGPKEGEYRYSIKETPDTARTYELDPRTGEYGGSTIAGMAELPLAMGAAKAAEIAPLGYQSDVVPSYRPSEYESDQERYRRLLAGQ